MSIAQYSGPSKIYFDAMLQTIINVGNLREESFTILDFGCGQGNGFLSYKKFFKEGS